jgi:hypothetical protein
MTVASCREQKAQVRSSTPSRVGVSDPVWVGFWLAVARQTRAATGPLIVCGPQTIWLQWVRLAGIALHFG